MISRLGRGAAPRQARIRRCRQPNAQAQSDFESPLHLRSKQFLRLQPPVTDALFEGVLAECIERSAIRLDAVRPIIVAEYIARAARMLVIPRDWEYRGRGGENAFHAATLSLFESVKEIHRRPGVAVQ